MITVTVWDPSSAWGGTSTAVTDLVEAGHVAREKLWTLWRRPGATVEIVDEGKIVWRQAPWEGVLREGVLERHGWGALRRPVDERL